MKRFLIFIFNHSTKTHKLLFQIHLIFSQKRDLETAQKYAAIARKMDSYNPHAFVNSGVIEMMTEQFDAAKFMFNNALEIDATLFEAIYNMGSLIPFDTLTISLFTHSQV